MLGIQTRTRVASFTAESKAKWHALAATFLGEGFDAMDASIYFIAMFPALSELLHTSDAVSIGWHGSIILALFMFGWSAGSILSGYAADKFGRVRTMIATILLYAAATGLCAAAHSWQELALCRFLVGVGIGGEIAIGGVVLSEAWKGKGKPWALAVMQTSFGVGCLACGLINLSTDSFGWRFLFLVGLAPALVALYMRIKLNESSAFGELAQRKRLLSRTPKSELTSEERKLLINPLLVAFDKENRFNTIICTLAAGSAIIGYWASLSWMAPWINQLTGTVAVAERSAATIYMGIGGIAGTLVTPLLIKHLGYRKSIILGFVASIVPALAMYLLVKTYSPAINVWAFVLGFGSYIPFLVVTIYSLQLFATNVLGSTQGIMWSGGRILTAFAGLCTGPLIVFFNGSYALAAATVSLVYLVGIAAGFFAKEPAKAEMTS